MTLAIILGITAMSGLVLVARGVFAPQPKLRTLADGSFRANQAALAAGDSTLGMLRARLLLILPADRLLSAELGPALAVTRTSPEALIIQKFLFGIVSLFLPIVVWAFGTMTELLEFNVLIAIVGGIVLAVAAFLFPDLAIRDQAEERREEFISAFAAFLNLTSILVGASDGPESALERAASQGEGWAFVDLRAAIESARGDTSLRHWDAIAVLGARYDIRELREFAGAMNASSSSATLSRTLRASAENLHDKQMAAIQAEAEKRNDRMDIPLTLLSTAVTVFLLYAALFQSVGTSGGFGPS